MKEKIVLGLSGGVDSAVAARLLQERYDVTGLYLDIGLGGTGAADAAAVAERLGIPFETADIRAELEREVCAPFAADYRAGRTPLPCARCNPAVKFPALFALAGRIGSRYVSTGHYARVENGGLKKGMPANDQSYMLARLTREQLQRVIFPLGDYEKAQVRALARDFGIPVADKPDSMEICFIPDGDYAAWLERRGFPHRRETLWIKRERCWAGTGGSTAIPWARAGAWGCRAPSVLCDRPAAGRQRGGALRRLRSGPGRGAGDGAQLAGRGRPDRPHGGDGAAAPLPHADGGHPGAGGRRRAAADAHPRPRPNPRPAGGVLRRDAVVGSAWIV